MSLLQAKLDATTNEVLIALGSMQRSLPLRCCVCVCVCVTVCHSCALCFVFVCVFVCVCVVCCVCLSCVYIVCGLSLR